MNFLAKHFFDYQSFVNIPHKAVQLHKTPYNEAGIDTTATWAPKNMRVQGRNLPTPNARANRNRIDAQLGAHRHGRPSKLEFRRFGERHGELKEERTVPHKDKWMLDLEGGDFRHFGEEEEQFSTILPNFLKNKSELDIELLTILTGGLKSISVTIKEIKGLDAFKNTSIRIQLYDGKKLIDERKCVLPRVRFAPQHILPLPNHENVHPIQNGPTSYRHPPPTAPASPQLQKNHVNRLQRRTASDRHLFDGLEAVAFDGESFLLQLSPRQIHTSFVVIQIHANRRIQREHRHLPSPEDDIEPETETVKDHFENDENVMELVGFCVIGSVGSMTRGYYHWQQMIRQQGHPVCMWHRLMGPKSDNDVI